MTIGYRHIALDRVFSTNDEAMARLRAGHPGNFVVTAHEQSGGRGRQGRTWASPRGNLYMSLALRDPAPAARAPQLGFVAGVALAEVLRTCLGGDARLQIKWPNDILFDGAKLAGMLLESSMLAGGALGCVVGIGVNCRSHPTGLGYPATNLAAADAAINDPASILADFTCRFEIGVRGWSGGSGFAAVRRAWLAMAAGLGEPIGITTPRGRLDGIFSDLDATGRLMLDTAGGMVAVEAGDVFFPALAAASSD